MKNVIIILLLFSCLGYSQQIVRPATDYYSADSIRNRTDLTRAIMDGVIKWKDSNFVEMEFPIYQPTLIVRFPKVDINGVPLIPQNYSRDTTYYTTQVTKVFDSVSKARYFGILYKPDSTKRHVKLISIVAKDSILKPLNCTECGVKKIKITFRETGTWNGSSYDVERRELLHSYPENPESFKIVGSYIRSSDASGMTIQTYATEDWVYNYKTADTYDPVTKKCTDWQPDWNKQSEYQAGNPQNETHYGVTYASLWRHTTNSARANKKCAKIGVENKITGVILESETHVNLDM